MPHQIEKPVRLADRAKNTSICLPDIRFQPNPVKLSSRIIAWKPDKIRLLIEEAK
jgi:hypothetical protein